MYNEYIYVYKYLYIITNQKENGCSILPDGSILSYVQVSPYLAVDAYANSWAFQVLFLKDRDKMFFVSSA